MCFVRSNYFGIIWSTRVSLAKLPYLAQGWFQSVSWSVRAPPATAGTAFCGSTGRLGAVPRCLGKSRAIHLHFTNSSGSTAQAEQIRWIMEAVVLPGNDTTCFPFLCVKENTEPCVYRRFRVVAWSMCAAHNGSSAWLGNVARSDTWFALSLSRQLNGFFPVVGCCFLFLFPFCSASRKLADCLAPRRIQFITKPKFLERGSSAIMSQVTKERRRRRNRSCSSLTPWASQCFSSLPVLWLFRLYYNY